MNQPPPWLAELFRQVNHDLQPEVPWAGGYSWSPPREPHGAWRASLYPAPGQLVGGPRDGAPARVGFVWPLHKITAVMDQIDGLYWRMPSSFETTVKQHEPSIVLVGYYCGRKITLLLSQAPPPDMDAVVFVDVRTGKTRFSHAVPTLPQAKDHDDDTPSQPPA